MTKWFAGKVALVTGGASGIGRATALAFAGEAYVSTDLQRYVGQMHGFFTLLILPGSELGFQQVVKAVRACIVRVRKAQPAWQ